ncbi:MAG: hypothetical protein F6K47_17175 [Symploca sp. SIO2E6]|nr:hypothetical protein [Symploca sp. SIO2E6]
MVEGDRTMGEGDHLLLLVADLKALENLQQQGIDYSGVRSPRQVLHKCLMYWVSNPNLQPIQHLNHSAL